MKSIVITGAAGFIGSCVVRLLNDQGIDRLILVDVIDHPEKHANLLGKQYDTLIPPSELFSWLEGRHHEISAFIHLGACSDTLETNESFLMENNFGYTVKLAEYALKYEKRFIYASSAATYGNGSLGFVDDHSALHTLTPLNLYGFSKHYFDLWAQEKGVLDRIVGLKYFNVFGPNENHKGRMASMVYKMVPILQKEGVVRLFKSTDPACFADGDQCRDFIYVKDAARMTVEFLSNGLNGIFNIGSGVATTWNTLSKALFSALNLPVQIEYIDMPQSLALQYQNFTCADMKKYKTEVKCDNPCHFSIQDSVCDYVEHLVENKRW
ncbi:MAG: hypothetical protein RLZZ453_417 [Chlamydiota bacterium]